jgi:magnesium-protoporphyrin O-methyltransferase
VPTTGDRLGSLVSHRLQVGRETTLAQMASDIPVRKHYVGSVRRVHTAAVTGCCDHDDYQSVFSSRFARRQSKRYQRRGLTPAARGIVEFATSQGIAGATVLEIGGGVGHLSIELLRRGASRVTNLEVSKNYEAEAARLLEQTGMTDRVSRRFLDIAQAPDAVEPADVVVLHRVVCCYPDYARLLKVAAGHARKTLIYSHPAANLINRVQFGTENAYRRLTRNDFRSFIHPPQGMIRAATYDGLAIAYQRHARDWDVIGLAR